MKRIYLIGAALAVASLPASPALAGWKLSPHGAATAVARGRLKVTPGEDWNRSSARPIKKGEVWTLDGQTLNELYFVSGLIAGETLFRDVDKKNRPLPKLRNGMDLTDIPEFFESSGRIALGTSVFTVSAVEPMQFAGRPGVKFTFEYAVEGSALIRKGVAAGTLVDNQLFLISFTAPAIHYFDRDRAKVEAILASAKI